MSKPDEEIALKVRRSWNSGRGVRLLKPSNSAFPPEGRRPACREGQAAARIGTREHKNDPEISGGIGRLSFSLLGQLPYLPVNLGIALIDLTLGPEYYWLNFLFERFRKPIRNAPTRAAPRFNFRRVTMRQFKPDLGNIRTM